jgi:hypothetical protein
MILKRKREHRVIAQTVNPVYAVYSCFTAGSLSSRLEALSHPFASVMRLMDADLLSATFGCGLTAVFRINAL